MENGTFLDEDYFEHLLAEIREIRLSERRFYQKLTDIYATAIDYNRDAPTTRLFFKMMQNKMHYAVHGRTAAELIVERADAEQEHMGLTTWENAPDGKIVKTDVSIAKNYLKEVELADMGQLVNGVLELKKPKNMPRQNLRSTASYKIVCSKATLTSIWLNYLLKVSKIIILFAAHFRVRFSKNRVVPYKEIYKRMKKNCILGHSEDTL